MKMQFKKLIIIFLLSLLCYSSSWALRESKPLAIDPRLRVMVYNPNDVFLFRGYYGYQSSIIFGDDETIETITLGDSVPWQIVPNNNRLFLKPIENDATTNMTLITNKRVYYFELHAAHAKNIDDPNMVFSMRFLYPEDGDGAVIRHFNASNSHVVEPDISDKSKYNFNYTISGPDSIAPIKIFDDKQFTYFQFREFNSTIPAFFLVDSSGNEGLVNYRMAGKYLVVERVSSKFSLRSGNDVVCVFNESMLSPEKNKMVQKHQHH